MNPRTKRSLVLGLVGSAALLTLFFACSRTDDERQRAYSGTGGSYYRRSRPWFHFGGWGSSYSHPSYHTTSSHTHSGPSSGHSGSVTSRGGFGGSHGGHVGGEFMRRIASEPRPDWREKVESQGLHFHTADGATYWDESVYYHFGKSEIDQLERATYELNDLCLKAVETVITNDRFEMFGIAPEFIPWVKRSWERDSQSLYGRFDFAYDGRGVPKMLEYNADTPTALLEAAVIQWFWKEDVKPASDQFNSLHERLIEFWQSVTPKPEGTVHFLSQRGHLEDFMTANYLRDTAEQAGLKSLYLPIEDIGWNSARKQFVDLNEGLIRTCFKLYPWEWMLTEEFGPQLPNVNTRWFEPPWKMLLSNKAILVVLWELFPECPYLLKAALQPWNQTHVKKPMSGREGENVTLVVNGQTVVETDGAYSEGPCVYQDVKVLPDMQGNYPVLGSWVVNGYACGLGIREDSSPVTRNTSRFVPHIFDDAPPPLPRS